MEGQQVKEEMCALDVNLMSSLASFAIRIRIRIIAK